MGCFKLKWSSMTLMISGTKQWLRKPPDGCSVFVAFVSAAETHRFVMMITMHKAGNSSSGSHDDVMSSSHLRQRWMRSMSYFQRTFPRHVLGTCQNTFIWSICSILTAFCRITTYSSLETPHFCEQGLFSRPRIRTTSLTCRVISTRSWASEPSLIVEWPCERLLTRLR